MELTERGFSNGKHRVADKDRHFIALLTRSLLHGIYVFIFTITITCT